MKNILKTANFVYTNCLRVNRHNLEGKEDDIAFVVLAVFVFVTMIISIAQL